MYICYICKRYYLKSGVNGVVVYVIILILFLSIS